MSIYNEYFGFKETPFSLTPDPEFLFLSSVHREALAYLRYGLREKKGFVLISGEVGSGKTTLLRSLLKDVDRQVRTALIINPRVEFHELMQSVFTDLEIDVDGSLGTKTELLDAFYGYLLDQHEVGCNVVLIFDEAQHLSLPVFEEIRMLSNFETPKEKLLQIIFVGQPELRQKLALPQLRQLRQRVTVRYHINPLNKHEVSEYITHRLQVAGTNDSEIFTPEAVEHIYDFSGGTPRLINVICDATLLAAFADGSHRVEAQLVQEAIMEQHAYDHWEEQYTEPTTEQTERTSIEQRQRVGSDTELLLDLTKTVLRLQEEVTERGSELADAAGSLRQRLQKIDGWLDSTGGAVPETLRQQLQEAAEMVTECAGQIDVHQKRLAPKLDVLDDVLSRLDQCIDRTQGFLNKLGIEDDGTESGAEHVQKDGGNIERRVRIHCSQCNNAHYIEGTFCPHCWIHIRRLKIGGVLDS